MAPRQICRGGKPERHAALRIQVQLQIGDFLEFVFQLSLWTVLGFLEHNLFHRPVLCLLFSLRFFKKNLIVCSLNQDLTVLWFKDWVSIRKEGSIYPKSPLGSSFLTPGHFVQELLGKEKDAENYLFKRNERLSYFPFTNKYFKTFFC